MVCEADHERRSVDWVRRDRGVCDVLLLDGVDEHRHVLADALDRSEWYAKRLRSEREADHERRRVDLSKRGYMSFSLENSKGKCWFRPESSGTAKAICCMFRLQNRFAASVSAHTFH